MVDTSSHHHRAYDILKSAAAAEQVSLSDLDKLKCFFDAEIGSPRRLDCIRTVPDLVDCLERRDIISEENVEPFRYFVGERVLQMVSNYVRPAKSSVTTPVNQYQQQRLSEELHQKLKLGNGVAHATSVTGGSLVHDRMQRTPSMDTTTSSTTAVYTSPYPMALTKEKRAAIFKLLSQELGRDWRKLGRELEIREGTMDEIEFQFPSDLSSRIYKLLQLFEEDECHDPKQNVLIICRALGECRRKDLRRKVENIMSY